MGKRDDRVDAYIAESADFAKPILTHLRELVHATCPDAEETMKWNFPYFMYKGLLCSMAAFKEHCAFGFWQSVLVLGEATEGAWSFDRITKLSDLPSKKALAGYIKKAKELNETGVKKPASPKKKAPRALTVPNDLAAALKKNAKAQATFDGFSPSHKRGYIDWITEAKTEATRERRVLTTIEWLAEGKPRNWKYMNC